MPVSVNFASVVTVDARPQTPAYDAAGSSADGGTFAHVYQQATAAGGQGSQTPASSSPTASPAKSTDATASSSATTDAKPTVEGASTINTAPTANQPPIPPAASAAASGAAGTAPNADQTAQTESLTQEDAVSQAITSQVLPVQIAAKDAPVDEPKTQSGDSADSLADDSTEPSLAAAQQASLEAELEPVSVSSLPSLVASSGLKEEAGAGSDKGVKNSDTATQASSTPDAEDALALMALLLGVRPELVPSAAAVSSVPMDTMTGVAASLSGSTVNNFSSLGDVAAAVDSETSSSPLDPNLSALSFVETVPQGSEAVDNPVTGLAAFNLEGGGSKNAGTPDATGALGSMLSAQQAETDFQGSELDALKAVFDGVVQEGDRTTPELGLHASDTEALSLLPTSSAVSSPVGSAGAENSAGNFSQNAGQGSAVAVNASSGTQSPTGAGAPLALNKPDWPQGAVDRVMWMSSQNLQSAEIRLDPAGLGRMSVHIGMVQDQAQVTFVSAQAGVRDVLEAQVPRLRELFTQQGLNLLDVTVSDQSMSGGAWQQGQGAQEQASRQSSASSPRTSAEAEEPVFGTMDISNTTARLGQGLVDYYA